MKHTAVPSAPAAAGPPSGEKEIDPSSIPTAIKYQDDNSLAHPNVSSLDLKNARWNLVDGNEFKLLSSCAGNETVGGNGFIRSYLLETSSWPPSLRAVTQIWIGMVQITCLTFRSILSMLNKNRQKEEVGLFVVQIWP